MHALHILTTNFFFFFFFFNWCVYSQIIKVQGGEYKMIFWPEQAEHISSVYLLNQIFESVSDLFAKENDMNPYLYNRLCVYIFLFDRIKN